jgi:hypothetical protein
MSVVEDLALAYDNPVMRALVQLVPVIGGPIDTVLFGAITQINARRAKTFFDELARGAAALDPQTIGSEPFLHAFFCTSKAALGTRQREKIELLARLLASGTRGVVEYGDDYEELLAILDETSHEELLTLSRLSTLEREHPHVWFHTSERETDEERAARIWPEFLSGFGSWNYDRIRAHMVRLERTGLYEAFHGGEVGPNGHQGRTTDSYRRLAAATQAKEESNHLEKPFIGDFELTAVRMTQTDPYIADATQRSPFWGSVAYHGTASLEGRSLQIAVEYLDKDDEALVLPLKSFEEMKFEGEFLERKYGSGVRCHVRIVAVL